jgi:hypothetical protein
VGYTKLKDIRTLYLSINLLVKKYSPKVIIKKRVSSTDHHSQKSYVDVEEQYIIYEKAIVPIKL